MYGLDINFLSDRNLETTKTTSVAKDTPGVSLKQQTPLLIGGGIGLALVALAGGFIFILNVQTRQTESNIAELDATLTRLGGKLQSIDEIKAQIETVNGEVTGLVSVFSQIKPWSALLEELKTQTPQTVQINSLQETTVTTGEGQAPALGLNITGVAQSYDAVNDFLLTLQNSPFLKAEQTKIQSAQQSGALNITLEEGSPYTSAVIPNVVQFNVTTQLNNLPATEMRRELANRGAVGLVSRLQTLEQTGAMK